MSGSIGRRHAANLVDLGAEVAHRPWRGFAEDEPDGAGFDGVVIATVDDNCELNFVNTRQYLRGTDGELPLFEAVGRQDPLAVVIPHEQPVGL